MELTPRDTPDAAPRRSTSKLVYVVVGALVLVLGFLVVNGLTNATVYFYEADEAVAQRSEQGDRRFRLQGEVVDGTIEVVGDKVAFAVEAGGVQVDVLHFGDPPELFQVGIPVVLEGRWSDADPSVFASDRILVKHSSEYIADNPDRTDDYTETDETEVP